MNGVLKFIIDLIVFLLSLGVLIVVHEAGHLTMAKLFKVYCYEFSIGMGPALYQHKPRKDKGGEQKVGKGETVFSVRALPIGGYVAMAGDDDQETGAKPDIVIPRERTIEGISHPKKALIMVAGVVVNFLIGYILFFFNYAFCPQPAPESNAIAVMKDSKIASLGVKTGDRITSLGQTFFIKGVQTQIDPVATESYNDISKALTYYSAEGEEVLIDYLPKSTSDYRIVDFTVADETGTERDFSVTLHAVINDESGNDTIKFVFESLGINVSTHMVGLGNAFVKAGEQWAKGCTAIFVALGQLFTPSGWSQMGGVVSMFKISSIATSNGLSVFFNLWGLISVNLAIFNLLPFPGLDGWQLVVTGIEGVSKKKLPAKFKTIASYVGLGLLMALMVVLLVKDIFFPVI